MKIVNLTQGTQEWLNFRRSGIGASDSAAILGKSVYKTPKMVWKEKILGEEQFVSKAMQYGKDKEEEIRRYLSVSYHMDLQPIVATHDENEWQFASFDAICPEYLTFYEIKCPQLATWERVIADKVPDEWFIQVQKQIYISDYTHGTLVVANPTDRGEKVIEIVVLRDDKMIEEIVRAETEFYEEYMLKMVEPPTLDLDILNRNDREWSLAASECKVANSRLNEAQENYERAKEALIKISGDCSCTGNGVTLTKYERKGAIDYAKIIRDYDIQGAERYRKESSQSWRLTIS